MRVEAEHPDPGPVPGGRSRAHYGILAGALVAALGLACLGLALTPDARGLGTHEQLGFAPCLPMDAWGVPCPGCGVTTAATLAAQGRPLESLATQPLGFLLALLVVLAVVLAPLAHFTGRDLGADARRLPTGLLWKAAVLVTALAWAWKAYSVLGV